MYGKIFASTFTGSMFGAGAHVFAVWAYALANSSANGAVELNPKLLSHVIGTPEKLIREAIELLEAPDPDSRTKAEEGRRIVREGMFLYRIVNYQDFRGGGGSAAAIMGHIEPHGTIRKGMVYFIAVGGKIKIGFSANPWARLAALKTGSPEPPRLLGYVPGATVATEKELHRRFEHLRSNLEWFRAEPELIEYIEKVATRSDSVATGTLQLQEEEEVEVEKDSLEPTLPGVSEPVVLSFPVVSRGKRSEEWGLTATVVRQFTEAYPAVDVLAEARRALSWIHSNPAKRKTSRGMQSFLDRWMSRVQDRGGSRGGPAPGSGGDLQEAERRLFGGVTSPGPR